MDGDALAVIGGGIAALFLGMSCAMGLMWQRLKDKDSTIGKLAREHQKEVRRLTNETRKVNDKYVELLKDMADSMQSSEEDEGEDEDG